jgi:hypothetical protein
MPKLLLDEEISPSKENLLEQNFTNKFSKYKTLVKYVEYIGYANTQSFKIVVFKRRVCGKHIWIN